MPVPCPACAVSERHHLTRDLAYGILHVLPTTHPCLSCGACCAAFRVAFYWAEAAPHSPDGVPEALTLKLDPQRVAMRGTDAAQPHCIALEGTVGQATRCSVYASRPSPCRELKAAWEDGQPSPQCDRARKMYGMKPLQREDWTNLSTADTQIATCA